MDPVVYSSYWLRKEREREDLKQRRLEREVREERLRRKLLTPTQREEEDRKKREEAMQPKARSYFSSIRNVFKKNKDEKTRRMIRVGGSGSYAPRRARAA